MDFMTWLAIGIFVVTIIVVIAGWIDSTAAALLGVSVMIWFGVMSEDDAFKIVDWNVMAILVSIWTIAGYFGKSGIPEWLSVKALRLSKGNPGALVVIRPRRFMLRTQTPRPVPAVRTAISHRGPPLFAFS